jgi:hypothetical protein
MLLPSTVAAVTFPRHDRLIIPAPWLDGIDIAIHCIGVSARQTCQNLVFFYISPHWSDRGYRHTAATFANPHPIRVFVNPSIRQKRHLNPKRQTDRLERRSRAQHRLFRRSRLSPASSSAFLFAPANVSLLRLEHRLIGGEGTCVAMGTCAWYKLV